MRTPHRLVITAAILAGFSLTTATTSVDASAVQPRPAVARTLKAPTKVLVIVEENHSLSQMQAGLPYLNRLATRKYGYARHYHAITHPSLPNYLAIAGGSTFGVTNDNSPSSNGRKVGRARSVFDQAIAHGYTAKTYAESMPGNCYAHPSGKYAVKHNPWAYFASGRRNCARYDVPMGTPQHGHLARDIARGHLPNVGMAVPNLCNDAHSCSLTTADRWLKGWLPLLLHTRAFTTGRLAVVVTADEGKHSGSNDVLTVVLHRPGRGGQASNTDLSHYSLSKFLSGISGARALRHARHAAGLGRAFGL
jgi:phosphatidylinositol-3-phosphatase